MITDEKIVLFARLKVKKGTEGEAKRAALSIIEKSRAESGCLNYDFHQVIDDAAVFLWHETWENETAIDAHANSLHFKEFSQAIENITDEPLQITLTRMVSEKA